MDSHCYAEESHYESLMLKQNSLESLLAQLSHACADIGDIGDEAESNKTSWIESEEITTLDPIRSEPIKSPVIESSLSQAKHTESSFLKTVTSSIDNESKNSIEPEKRRARLVRLQPARSSELQNVSGPEDPEKTATKASSANLDNQLASQQSPQLSTPADGHLTCPIPTSIQSTSDSVLEPKDSEDQRDSDDLKSSPLAEADAIPDPRSMQRFLMSDGQYVYGCRDASGELQFFYPTLQQDRESHNEKERERRSRVSQACNSLRRLVPGLSEKTDKASVFEHTARYLQFLRFKYGDRFDQAYGQKYFIERT